MTMLLLLLGLACGVGKDAPGGALGEDSVPLTCEERPPSVTIGGSSVDELGRPIWVEMPEGSAQTMVHGPQGGWHILASADVQSTNQIVTIDYTIRWPAQGDAQLSFGTFRVMLVPDDRCGGYYAGMLGILTVTAFKNGDLDTPPELLGGEELSLRMDIVDLDGLKASDERTVIAALDPADTPDTGD